VCKSKHNLLVSLWILIDNESNPSREAMLIATKLKLATDSYILQQKRAKLIHNEKPTCKLRDAEDEDVEHFILRCVCNVIYFLFRFNNQVRAVCKSKHNLLVSLWILPIESISLFFGPTLSLWNFNSEIQSIIIWI
jgi:hypothetical protein